MGGEEPHGMQNYLRANATRRVASVSLAVVTIIATAVGVTIWRYQVAQSDGATAVRASRDASNARELIALVWHQRESMNEYLFGAAPDVAAEISTARQVFVRTAASITPPTPAAAQALARALTGHAALYAAFLQVRSAAGTTPARQRAANDHVVLD